MPGNERWTPGPWQVTYAAVAPLPGTEAILAAPPFWSNPERGRTRTDVANLHLAAAAPDLYAACNEALGMLEAAYANLTNPQDRSGWSDDDAWGVAEMLKAALGRARGEP